MDNISIIKSNYTEITKLFPLNSFDSKFEFLKNCCDNFIKKRNIQSYVLVDETLLATVVLDYYTDISRIKNFHNIEKTNFYKVIGYLCYWLWRRKPIQIKVKIDNLKAEEIEEICNINELFILNLILTFLSSLIGKDIIKGLSEKNKSQFLGFYQSLYYYLKYRTCNPQAIEMFLICYAAGLISCGEELVEDPLSNFFEKSSLPDFKIE